MDNQILVLKTVDDEGFDPEGIQMPPGGPVTAPEWTQDHDISTGIKGSPYGNCLKSEWLDVNSKNWIVVRVESCENNFQKLEENLVKFNSGHVVFSGDLYSAKNYIEDRVKNDEHLDLTHVMEV